MALAAPGCSASGDDLQAGTRSLRLVLHQSRVVSGARVFIRAPLYDCFCTVRARPLDVMHVNNELGGRFD